MEYAMNQFCHLCISFGNFSLIKRFVRQLYILLVHKCVFLKFCSEPEPEPEH